LYYAGHFYERLKPEFLLNLSNPPFLKGDYRGIFREGVSFKPSVNKKMIPLPDPWRASVIF